MIAARLALYLVLSCPGVASGQTAAPTTDRAVASGLPGVTDSAPHLSQPGTPTAGFPYTISQCWVVSALSPEAQRIRVTLALDLGHDGRPLTDTIRLIEASGGGAQATEQAFQSARLAILRCAQSDPDLRPLTSEEQRSLEITFDPSWPSDR